MTTRRLPLPGDRVAALAAGALALLGATATAAVLLLAPSHPPAPPVAEAVAPASPPPAPRLGPVALGMARAEAVAAAGPGALVGPLCGKVEGILADLPAADPASDGTPGATLMAMLGADGRVTELDAALADPAGTRGATACDALFEGRAALALATLGPGAAPIGEEARSEAAGIARRALAYRAPDGTEARAFLRRSARSGACFVNLRLLAAGAAPTIPVP